MNWIGVLLCLALGTAWSQGKPLDEASDVAKRLRDTNSDPNIFPIPSSEANRAFLFKVAGKTYVKVHQTWKNYHEATESCTKLADELGLSEVKTSDRMDMQGQEFKELIKVIRKINLIEAGPRGLVDQIGFDRIWVVKPQPNKMPATGTEECEDLDEYYGKFYPRNCEDKRSRFLCQLS